MAAILYANLNRDQIAARLLEIADQKLLVKRVVNKYRNNPFYSTIFNSDDVESELYNTVFSVMNALDRYNQTQVLVNKKEQLKSKLTEKEFSKLNDKLTPALKAKISRVLKMTPEQVNEQLQLILDASNGELNLATEPLLTGYLIVAFKNSISKIYGKYQTDKRHFNQMVYLDSYSAEAEDSSMVKNKMDSVGSVDPVKEKEYSSLMVDMALYLKKHDRKQNQVNQNQKSQLAKLFCSIVNPKKVEDNDELRNRFGWSQYLLNKNKELLVKKLKEEFSDCQEEVIGFFDQREQLGKAS